MKKVSTFRPLVWLGRHELGFLLTLAAILFGIWMFVMLADEITEGGTAGIDRKLLLALRKPGDLANPIGGPLVEEAARDVTALGGLTVCSLLTLIVGGYLILDGKTRMALFVWAAVASGAVASTLLKHEFNRPRPDLVPHAMRAMGTSFPSGHSMTAAVVYLTLGALLARSFTRRRVKAYFILVAIFISIAVGFTRVYLGVHWPTDVIGGWTAGAVWALICSLIAGKLQKQHSIEQEEEHAPEPSAVASSRDTP